MKTWFAERIGGKDFLTQTAIYKFEKIKRLKRQVLQTGADILDMGIGEPSEMAYSVSVETLGREAGLLENNGYTDNGSEAFRAAVVDYMGRTFAVQLETAEVLHTTGTKSALAMFALACINPGDVALTTVPGYPVFGTHVQYLGGEVYTMPLLESNAFLPDIDSIDPKILKRAKVLLLNYPNNPTGACASIEFFQKVIVWAKKHSILIIHDAAYAALYHDQRPLSLLSLPGAKEVAVELHSMSKAFNMTGWRIGWVCGNKTIVDAYGYIKQNTDSGQYLPIQNAAAKTLSMPDLNTATIARYKERKDALLNILNAAGFSTRDTAAGFFLYARSPGVISYRGQKLTFASAEHFSLWLLENLHILCVPWDEAGPYLRFSLTFPSANDASFFQTLTTRLQTLTIL
ncbi:MAG: hypothetical protein A2Y14_04895 [Verrucomicrobia bacterium GWF2_51_19]|nr:MAG: hypothetical protein A2Y14_04895 [Verrucomicrobia bacterium GWF2_51_19]HCJ11948.1 LL-diaminopimelate aminotransferase [Opitutae bacterium]